MLPPLALALSDMALAADENALPGDTSADDTGTDNKASCIADIIASDLEEDQKDKNLGADLQGQRVTRTSLSAWQPCPGLARDRACCSDLRD